MASKRFMIHRGPATEPVRSYGDLPVVRSYALPNGSTIVSVSPGTFRSAVDAANSAIRKEVSSTAGHIERAKRA